MVSTNSHQDQKKWQAIIPIDEGAGQNRFVSTPNWGLIIDLIRSLDQEITIDLDCSATPNVDQPKKEKSTVEGQESTKVTEYSSIFDLIQKEVDDHRLVTLRIKIGSDTKIPTSVLHSIAIELLGANRYEIVKTDQKASDEIIPCSPATALKTFHPPFGRMYSTSGARKHELRLFSQVSDFPDAGVLLGKSYVRQVRSDQHVDVRISAADRLRHMYVVGKTGTGKTNLLKVMASQDVKDPSRGVTIIDPHGDLVDYVLREVPVERIQDVILVDLSNPSGLPIINPLDVNPDDDGARDRIIQQLVALMESRVYHQFTGPRFAEIVRHILSTMFDSGYPVYPSMIEIPDVIYNEELQDALKSLVVNPSIKSRWEFENKLKTGNEYGELAHYVASKFSDLYSDNTLKCVVGGGKSTIKIEDIVEKGRILLVKIPEAHIGKEAADFIGSLILMQLRTAITRRREQGEVENYHFVYVDEFQNFANTDFHTIVAEARKFNIGFILANQNLEQLRDFRTHTGFHEQRLINAILGNVANLIAFSVGTFDAEQLGNHFNIEGRTLLNLGRFQALAKILVHGRDSRPFTLHPPEAVWHESPRIVSSINELMWKKYWISPGKTLKEIESRPERILAYSKLKGVPISESDLASNVKTALLHAGYHSLAELSVEKDETLLEIKGIGQKTVAIIRELIHSNIVETRTEKEILRDLF